MLLHTCVCVCFSDLGLHDPPQVDGDAPNDVDLRHHLTAVLVFILSEAVLLHITCGENIISVTHNPLQLYINYHSTIRSVTNRIT